MPPVTETPSHPPSLASEDTALPAILCVDDDPQILVGLARTLRREFSVTTAVGAEAGIRAIAAGGEFAVVVSDLHMPQMDGIEFLRWVSVNSPPTSGILLTGNANLTAAIAAVNAGYITRFLTKPCASQQLIEAIHVGVERHAARRAEQLLLSNATDRDALTGLPDRRRFALDVERLVKERPGACLSLIVVAVDELDLVRRTLGHASADQLLLAAAGRLHLAKCDPRYSLQHAILYRMEDRLALLWHAQSDTDAESVAEHLLRILELDVCLEGQKLRLSGHAGIVAAVTVEPLTALRNAEAACLEAIAGLSRSAHYSQSNAERDQRRLRLSQRLRDPSFVFNLDCVYQPQWDFASNDLAGLEALARWHDPELGAVSPGEFVPLAEQDPEIAEQMGEWILLTACRQRLEWRGLIPDAARVAVNISATELQSGALHDKVMKCLQETGLPANLLEIEITESSAIQDLARSDAQLQALRRDGVEIAIDDFGVGYSSLSYLAELPAASLKIDRSFIVSVDANSRRADLLRGICGLGHAMRMRIIMEGVESLVTAAWLRAIGCDAAQGFALARPLAADAFVRWCGSDRHALAAALAESHDAREAARGSG